MTEPERPSPDRAEEAFRSALALLDAPAVVDPAAARSRVRRRRLAGVLITGAAILVAAVLVPAVTHYGLNPVGVFANPTGDSGEWRTEHYRNITFSVPSSWTYGKE